MRIHCFSGGRPRGTAKVEGSQRQRRVGLAFSSETTFTENEGSHLRGLRKRILADIERPAKTCSGNRISSSRLRNTRAEAKPDTTIGASMTATRMYKRLLPVFRAAIPISNTVTT